MCDSDCSWVDCDDTMGLCCDSSICNQLGLNCDVYDGCGGALDCGRCPTSYGCGANVPGVCDCSFPNDVDCDGVADIDDNCPTVVNTAQSDSDDNGVGDRCEPWDSSTFLWPAPIVLTTGGRRPKAVAVQDLKTQARHHSTPDISLRIQRSQM